MGPLAGALLDSAILIDHFNGVAAATRYIAKCESPAISVITWVEVVAGFRSPESEAEGRALLATFPLLPLSEPVAEETVRVRRSTRLKLPDAIILATARVHGMTLITRNTRDFPSDDPSIVVPYSL